MRENSEDISLLRLNNYLTYHKVKVLNPPLFLGQKNLTVEKTSRKERKGTLTVSDMATANSLHRVLTTNQIAKKTKKKLYFENFL